MNVGALPGAPMKREGTKWSRVSWDQALEEIGAKLKQLRGDHGPDSLAMYVGTAAGFGVLHPVFAQGFRVRNDQGERTT